ncbi:MAG TPA: DUF559 domain-containing protein [Caulobacteraceae bacterium]|nr:DUF559 domain-containing protein [Caulobacteraceae bacterium]
MEPSARIRRARGLRVEATDVERKLWAVLRARQLGGFKFRRQLPIDRYIADFACVEARLIIELDGGQHLDNADRDERRTRVLEACGWRVIQFWNTDLIDDLDGVARDILAELKLPAA